MWKFLGYALLLGGVFWAGYYVGQKPPGEVKQQLQTFSEDVVQRAFGLDQQQLYLQREMLEAKARFLNSQSAILEKNYEVAERELQKALAHLEKAGAADLSDSSTAEAVRAKVKELRASFESGQQVSREKIKVAQDEIDRLLSN